MALLVVCAVSEITFLATKFSRFSEEIFTGIIAIFFTYEATKSIIGVFFFLDIFIPLFSFSSSFLYQTLSLSLSLSLWGRCSRGILSVLWRTIPARSMMTRAVQSTTTVTPPLPPVSLPEEMASVALCPLASGPSPSPSFLLLLLLFLSHPSLPPPHPPHQCCMCAVSCHQVVMMSLLNCAFGTTN